MATRLYIRLADRAGGSMGRLGALLRLGRFTQRCVISSLVSSLRCGSLACSIGLATLGTPLVVHADSLDRPDTRVVTDDQALPNAGVVTDDQALPDAGANADGGIVGGDLIGDDLVGTWLTDEGRFRVVISRCSEAAGAVGRDEAGSSTPDAEPKYCGTIVWARPFTEEEQREFADDGRPLDPMSAIGSEVIQDFVHHGNGDYAEGKFYFEAKDKLYSGTMKLVSKDVLDVTVRVAYIFRKTARWTRWSG